MVGVGTLMLLVSWAAVWRLKPWQKYKPADPKRVAREWHPWHLKILVAMTFAGWVAVVAGLYTTEIGRQPYLVYGVLKTAVAVSAVPATHIALTLALYLMLYAALTVAYISVVFYLARHKKHADKPFGDEGEKGTQNQATESPSADLEHQLNLVNYPEKESAANHRPPALGVPLHA